MTYLSFISLLYLIYLVTYGQSNQQTTASDQETGATWGLRPEDPEQNRSLTTIAEKEVFFKGPSIFLEPKNFTELICRSNLFVDKSLLIKELLEDPSQFICITRPPYWGKTMNIDMLRIFLQMPVNSHGNPIPPIASPNRRLFLDGQITCANGIAKLKSPLLIAQHQHLVDKFLGKHPVVYIDFKGIDAETYNGLMAAFIAKIGDTFRTHLYLVDQFEAVLQHPNKTRAGKIEATRNLHLFYSFLLGDSTIHRDDMTSCIRFLCDLLYQRYNTTVFVLIDEYDAPSNVVFANLKYANDEKHKFLHFYTEFIVQTFLNNTYLEKGIITGIFPLSFEQLDSIRNVSNVTEYTFYDGLLMEYYGFSEYEMNSTFKILNATPAQHKLDFFYQSYRYKFRNFLVKMHNPYSVATFLATKRTTEWLNIPWIENLLNFFMEHDPLHYHTPLYTVVSHLGAVMKIKYFETGHFSWDELDMLHTSIRCTYYQKWHKERMDKFQTDLFAGKAIMFLYTYGFLTFTDTFGFLTRYLAVIKFPYNVTGERLSDLHITHSIRVVLKSLFSTPYPEAFEHITVPLLGDGK